MVLWQRANLPLLLLDLAVFLLLPLRHPSLYSLSSEILMVLRSFCLDCLAATVPPSGSESGL